MNWVQEYADLYDRTEKKIRILTSVLTDAAITLHRSHSRYQFTSDLIPSYPARWESCNHPFCVRVRHALED